MLGKVLLGTAAILAVIAVAACDTPESMRQERENITMKLPPGCEFQFLGEYGSMKIAAVICEGKKTTSTNIHWRTSSGKSSTNHYNMVTQVHD